MAVYNSPPKMHTTEAMFIFWAENMKKEKPHLIIKNLNNNHGHRSKPVELWYEVKQELVYLEERNLLLDEKAQGLELIDRDIKTFTPTTQEIFEIKKEIMDNKIKIKSLEKLSPNKKEMILDYPTFKKIVVAFNNKAVDYIVKGETLNLGSRLGYVQIRKIKPLKRVERIDWEASNKYKLELIAKGVSIRSKTNTAGKNWLIYRNVPYYLRWAWSKNYGDCTVKNNKVYGFYATSSTSNSNHKALGTKTKLVQAQQQDSLLHTRYVLVDQATRTIKKAA